MEPLHILLIVAIILVLWYIWHGTKEYFALPAYMQTPPATMKMKEPKSEAFDPTFKETGQLMAARGEEDLDWEAVAAASTLEPSVYASHKEYVKDVRKFSSGAGFTSVDDDNLGDYNNFVGIFRPVYVPEGSTARQVSSTDPGVNKRFSRKFKY